MTSENYKILIEDIENSKNKQIDISFDDFIEGIKSTKPIKARLKLSSLGEFVQIQGEIEGLATLTCDLCLEEYEYKLAINIDEMYSKTSLKESYSDETELKSGQFITDLDGKKDIDILDLLYQSVILDFPNKKVCGINCKGGDIFIRDENYPQEETDPRMAVFKEIEVKKKK